MAVTTSKTLGKMMENPFAEIFGGEFKDFISPLGIIGQVRVKGDVCDLLSVLARRPGRGDFKRFLKSLQREFPTIRVLHVHNLRLRSYLKRVGFTRTSWREPDGELVPALVWAAAAPSEAE